MALILALWLVLAPNYTDAGVQQQLKQESLKEEIQTLAKEYQVSATVATDIIHCESHNDPAAVRINAHSKDIGYFQINNKFWAGDAAKMGLNIYDPQDNLVMGFWILKHYGTSPWNWSKPCWGHEN